MAYTLEALQENLQAQNPDIKKNGFALEIGFDEYRQRYTMKLSKGNDEVGYALAKEDADDFMAGKKCLNLTVQMAQMVTELQELVSPRKPG